MKGSHIFLLSVFIAVVSFVAGSYWEGLFYKKVPFLVTDTITVTQTDSVKKIINDKSIQASTGDIFKEMNELSSKKKE